MLIWYANMPEETTISHPCTGYLQRGILDDVPDQFHRPAADIDEKGIKKKLYNHYIHVIAYHIRSLADFFQMVHPGPSPDHVPMLLYDFCVGLGFVGLIMFVTGKALSKYPLIAKNHPFIKESVIHHT